jgi:hypothetical protein
MTTRTAAIEIIADAYRTLGYVITAEPIPGMEDQFVSTLVDGFSKLTADFQQSNKRYGYRGRSKAALAALHSAYPRPVFGVEVR